MFNVGGGEFLVILLVALIILGPQKLPEAARQVASVARELRRISSGFQDELRSAMDEPIESDARTRGRSVVSSSEQPAPVTDDEDDEEEPTTSTAERAGMYDLEKRAAEAARAAQARPARVPLDHVPDDETLDPPPGDGPEDLNAAEDPDEPDEAGP